VRILLLAVVVVLVAIFVFRREPMPVVKHIAPEGPVRADTTVRFAWHSVHGAVRYRIDVSRPDGVAVASAATLGDTTIDVSTLALTRGVNYRWIVTAIDRKGRVSRTTPVEFTVTR
jgi:hypothetical protein